MTYKVVRDSNGNVIEWGPNEDFYEPSKPYTIEQDPPDFNLEQIISSFTLEIQKRLDVFARTRNYDGILSSCTYATSLIPKFKAEGQYAVEARDNTWAAAYELLAEVEAGTRPMPTLDEVIAALPVLVWPQ